MALALALAGGTSARATPPNGGTISIESAAIDGDDDELRAAFVSAAGEALGKRGFTILQDRGHAAYVAALTISRVEVGTGLAKVATGHATISPGNAGASAGAGIFVPISTAKTRQVALQRTRLDIRIRKRGQEGLVWQGAAVTVRAAGTRGAGDMLASDLSEALLRSYPASFTTVVGVP